MQRLLRSLGFGALLGLLLLQVPKSRGLIPAAGIWEIRPTNGNDNNGGCFVTGATGTDFSQQNAVQYTFTDLAIDATTNTKVTSASHNFVAADVGNCMHISAGTGFTAQWFSIVSVASNAATLDRSAGTTSSTGGTFFVGGALKTIAGWNTATNNSNAFSNSAWMKAEATVSTASQITLPGPAGAPNTNQLSFLAGYTSSRGDGGQVTIQASAGSFTVVSQSGTNSGMTVRNFIVDCNAKTSSSGWVIGNAFLTAENILIENCTSNFGFEFNNVGTICRQCFVTALTGGTPFQFQANRDEMCIDCVAYANTGNVAVFNFSGSEGICYNCIAGNNTGSSAHGFSIGSGSGFVVIQNAIAYKNGGDGLRTTIGTMAVHVQNFISYGNSGWGQNCSVCSTPQIGAYMNFNAYGGNTSGNLQNVTAGANDVTLTADPFVAGTSNNYALNSTAGGGTALKGTGYPGVLATGGTGFQDIGVLQHQATAGGQKGFPIIQ